MEPAQKSGLQKLNEIWPKLGGLIALVIVIVVGLMWNSVPQNQIPALLFWLNWALLMFHEFEEYVFPGGFKEFANTKTVLSAPEGAPEPTINDKLIAAINLGAWALFILAALLANIAPWLGLGMVIFNVVNIVGHLFIFEKKSKGYNPGMVTAFLMIPFLVWVFIVLAGLKVLTPLDYTLATIIGVLSGALLPIIGFRRRKRLMSKNKSLQ